MIKILVNEGREKNQGRIMLGLPSPVLNLMLFSLWKIRKERNKRENLSVTAKQLPYLILERNSFRNGQVCIWVSVVSTIKSLGMRQGNRCLFLLKVEAI